MNKSPKRSGQGPIAAARELGNSARITMGLLESVDRDGGGSQRKLAAELGVALGLVNAYLKRCINKGLIKVRQAPAHRYVYYLTPRGFAEKTRLTAEYLSYSFSFFRRAKADCKHVLDTVAGRGFTRVVLAGRSELAEIATICAIETKTTIVAVVDVKLVNGKLPGAKPASFLDQVRDPFDAVVITALEDTAEVAARARERVGEWRVLVPNLLRGRIVDNVEGQA